MAKVEDLSGKEISTSDFANLVGKTPQWIRQLTRDGILVQSGRGKYKIGQNILAYIEHTAGGKAGDDKMTHADVKAEHEMLKKEKTELQLQELRGQLHDANDVRALVGDMILNTKSKLLAIPVRVSPQLEGESAKAIEKILKNEIDGVLWALANHNPDKFIQGDNQSHEVSGTPFREKK